MGNDFKVGVGREMEDKPANDGAEERRKRSIYQNLFPNEVIKSSALHRAKRQSESPQMPNIPQNGMPGGNADVFERIKATFNRIVEATKEMIQKMRSMAGQGSKSNAMPPIPQNSNAESFQ